MIIALDLDGTVAKWEDTYDKYLDHMGDVAINIPRTRDQETFNLWEGRTVQESEILHKIMDTPGFYREIDPMPGAIDAVRQMISDGHTVFFVTAPHPSNPTCADDKIWWTKTHFGSEYVDKLVITRDKTCIRADVLVDDRPDIHGQLTPEWTQIFYDQPYNRAHTDRDRIKSWVGEGWKNIIYGNHKLKTRDYL